MKNLSLYFAKIFTTLSTFIFNIYLAKIADLEYFGVFNLLLNFTFLFNLISDWGFSTYGPSELSKLNDGKEVHFYLSNILTFRLFLCIVCSLLYLLLIFSFYDNYLLFLGFGIFLILLNFLNVDWIARGTGNYSISSLRQIINALLNVVSVVMIYILSLNIIWVYITYTTSIIFSYFISIKLLNKHNIKLSLKVKKGISELRITFLNTKFAFLGILLFNVIYSLNLPILTLFGNKYEASLYASYYAIFSSLSAIVLITQDVFFPHFSIERKEPFIESYSFVIMLGAFIMVLIVLLLPLYYNLLYPKSFKLEKSIYLMICFLCVLFSFRLLFAHSLILVKSYQLFYQINLIGIVAYISILIFLIIIQKFNTTTAYLSIVLAELLIVCISLKKYIVSFKTIQRSFMMFIFSVIVILIINMVSHYSIFINVVLLIICLAFFIRNTLKSLHLK